MAEFSYDLSKYLPFRDAQACRNARAIRREDITRHPNSNFRIRVIENDQAFQFAQIVDIVAGIKRALDEGRDKYVIILPAPMPAYALVAHMINELNIPCHHVHTFNMDEYVGLPEEHPESYHSFMWNNFFSHVDIKKENVHILNGNAKNLVEECASYEQKITEAGGIQLFLGGIGVDGHIAFNEPFSSLTSRTRVKTLTYDTKVVNSRFFDNDVAKVPSTAMTVGVATVMDAKQVVIVVNGHAKARALQAAVEGPVSHMWTISALQMHPKAIIVCDEPATDELKVSTWKYFKDIESEHLDPEKLLRHIH